MAATKISNQEAYIIPGRSIATCYKGREAGKDLCSKDVIGCCNDKAIILIHHTE